MSAPRFLHKVSVNITRFFIWVLVLVHINFKPKLDEKKMGLKQTLDISLVPYDRCKKLIKFIFKILFNY